MRWGSPYKFYRHQEDYEQIYAKKVDNLSEMDKFPEKNKTYPD